MLVSAVALTAVGRVSRWRPHWLALATAAGVIWLSAVGPARSLTAFAAGSQRVPGFLLAAASHPRLFAHPGMVAAGASPWQSAGLSLAMLAGCGEAWLLLWLGWWRLSARSNSEWRWRPGLVAAVRRPMSTAALTAGRTVTSDGCAVALASDTGKLAGFSWAEAKRGVLLTGPDVDGLGLAITCAALRRRKSVVILDCAGATAGGGAQGHLAAVADRVRLLARSLGVPVTAADSAAVVAPLGRAIRRREAVVIGVQPADGAPRAVADVAAVLGELRDLGLRADCVAWITGVEVLDPAGVAELLALGPLTGTVVVLSTTSSAHAAQLASVVGVMAVGRPMARARASASDDANREIPIRQPAGGVTLSVFSTRRAGSVRVVTNCRVLPIALHHPQ